MFIPYGHEEPVIDFTEVVYENTPETIENIEKRQRKIELGLADTATKNLLSKDEEVALGQTTRRSTEVKDALDNIIPLDIGSSIYLSMLQDSYGDQVVDGVKARNIFISRNKGLVDKIANRRAFHDKRLEKEDHAQNGTLGLIEAVESYDWRKGFKFSSHATWAIRNSINRGVEESGRIIRLPDYAIKAVAKYNRLKTSNDPELIAEAQAMKSEVALIPEAGYWLDKKIGESKDITISDMMAEVSPQSPEIIAIDKTLVDQIFAELTDPVEIDILYRLYYEDQKTKDIAEHYQVTSQAISVRTGRIYKKIRMKQEKLARSRQQG